MKKPRTVQPNINDQSKNKNEKQKQKEQNDNTNKLATHPRFDHASVKSDTLRPVNPSQNLYPQASQAKVENLPAVDSGMKPVIKMEERKMWRTTWTAEGSKEPFDKYIIRKRNEVMDTVARPETDAKSGAPAEAGLERTDKCETFSCSVAVLNTILMFYSYLHKNISICVLNFVSRIFCNF